TAAGGRAGGGSHVASSHSDSRPGSAETRSRTMKPLPHQYDVHLTGGPSGYAQLSAPGLPQLQTAPPAEYDGPGDAWSPEHLLLAAVQACFLFTLRAVAKMSKLEFTALELDAIGT